MVGDIGKGLGLLLKAMFWLIVVFVPLGIWKLIELIF